MRRVLIVDDHPVVLEGLTSVLAVAGLHVVGTATDAMAALRAIAEYQPAVVIVDLSLRGHDGFWLLGTIREQHPDVATVVYSMRRPDDVAQRCRALGACDYIPKTASVDELIAALHDAVPRPLGRAEIADPFGALSAREREVLKLLSDGLSPGDISRKLEIAATTVSTHIRRIKDKLAVESVGDLIRRAADL